MPGYVHDKNLEVVNMRTVKKLIREREKAQKQQMTPTSGGTGSHLMVGGGQVADLKHQTVDE